MSDLDGSRRNFLRALTTTTVLSAAPVRLYSETEKGEKVKTSEDRSDRGTDRSGSTPELYDGPASPLFEPVPFTGNASYSELAKWGVSQRMAEAAAAAPTGPGTAWGIPFEIPGRILLLRDKEIEISVSPFSARWLVFLHSSDSAELERDESGFHPAPFRGAGLLSEHAADYVVIYADGAEQRLNVRHRLHIGMFQQIWGENCIEAVAHHKPAPQRAHHEQAARNWGGSQTRVNVADRGRWINWLWAWPNPRPDVRITGFRFEPKGDTAIALGAISAGRTGSNPLRWGARAKALLKLQKTAEFDPELSDEGLLSQIQLDLGQVISAAPRPLYPQKEWSQSYNNKVPELSKTEILIEFCAHPEARFHFLDRKPLPVAALQQRTGRSRLRPVPPADRRVKLRVVEKERGRPVAVKLHVHGEPGEYLAPEDRHRIANDAWFEDYSVDFVHSGLHTCTYIPGETVIKLPAGKVYIEVSKGFEIRPLREVLSVKPDTEEFTLTVEKVLPWREKGWVSADTHVHFLTPHSARLEGAAEGVNIINLLASQWGELMTNVGDFDGRTTLGSRESGGDGEYLVRVGTENRQHVLGHISLLGYEGGMITPMTTGGPDESALGDPIEVLLTEWARQCKTQNGVVILPHFPNPRLENAAAIVHGEIDGVEMTSWGNLYGGINPYSLTDWYRYLNCGYFVAAVGGTDKMSAGTAVGTVRTYARIDNDRSFTYEAWKDAVRKGRTFVSYGPLLDFNVDGKAPGERIRLSRSGGTVDVSWQAASVTVPMTRVELIVNGEVRESTAVGSEKAEGHWSVKAERSSWMALLVRGHYPDKPEIIAAHSTPVMVDVDGSEYYAAADALTILEQIEGALAYLDTLGTRSDDAARKRMRMILESAHRRVHNRMHQLGHFHEHTPAADHEEHRGG